MKKSRALESKYVRRGAVEVWYPKAHELQLPNVPPEERRAIRKKLAPILAILHDHDENRVGVKFGDCWNIAQSLKEAKLALSEMANDVNKTFDYQDERRTRYTQEANRAAAQLEHIAGMFKPKAGAA